MRQRVIIKLKINDLCTDLNDKQGFEFFQKKKNEFSITKIIYENLTIIFWIGLVWVLNCENRFKGLT